MPIDVLLDKITKKRADEPAMIWKGRVYSYSWLSEKIKYLDRELREYGLSPGMVVQLQSDYSPITCSLLISLIKNKTIVVPVTSPDEKTLKKYQSIAEVQSVFTIDLDDSIKYQKIGGDVSSEVLKELRHNNEPGLILFSSGATGTPKAIVHSFDRILRKFLGASKSLRTLTFLMFDHIAGIDTLFYSLFSGGTLVFPTTRTPSEVCYLIERHGVEVLPTSPTFLNLLLISEEYKNHDLSSLRIITYGSEVMSPMVLKRLNEVFPNCRIIQKYGITELGSPSSKSEATDSLWIKMDSESFKTKVIDGTLWIKAESAMIGYLNAPSPFDESGWFNTEDQVEVKGEYIKILGRKSDIINVGGEKVYPAEVESILLEMDNIVDVTVTGESNSLLGQIVVARVNLANQENINELKQRIREFCRDKLEQYKIPVRIEITNSSQFGTRFKKMRC